MKILNSVIDFVISKLANSKPQLQPDQIIEVFPEVSDSAYNLPQNFYDLPDEVKANYIGIVNRKIYIPVRHLFTYRDVYVGQDGVVYKTLQVAVPSLRYYTTKEDYLNAYLIRHWNLRRKVLSPDITAGVIHDNDATGNYYHWLIESCPRLLILRERFPGVSLIVPLMKPGPVPAYITSSTALLGFDNLIPISPREIVKAPLVVLAEHAGEHKDFDLHQDPRLLVKLRQVLIDAIGVKSGKPFRRVYISREKQKMRRLDNEPEFLALLQKYDFEILFFENLSFEDQIRVMYETEVLIGVHGANLTNSLFLQRSAAIIEIINREALNNVYFRIASYIGIKYYSIPSAGTQPDKFKNDSNLEVEVKTVEAVFQDIFN